MKDNSIEIKKNVKFWIEFFRIIDRKNSFQHIYVALAMKLANLLQRCC